MTQQSHPKSVWTTCLNGVALGAFLVFATPAVQASDVEMTTADTQIKPQYGIVYHLSKPKIASPVISAYIEGNPQLQEKFLQEAQLKKYGVQSGDIKYITSNDLEAAVKADTRAIVKDAYDLAYANGDLGTTKDEDVDGIMKEVWKNPDAIHNFGVQIDCSVRIEAGNPESLTKPHPAIDALHKRINDIYPVLHEMTRSSPVPQGKVEMHCL